MKTYTAVATKAGFDAVTVERGRDTDVAARSDSCDPTLTECGGNISGHALNVCGERGRGSPEPHPIRRRVARHLRYRSGHVNVHPTAGTPSTEGRGLEVPFALRQHATYSQGREDWVPEDRKGLGSV